ncbi:hypothetical protein KCG43_21220, partial [Photobacterium sp. WH24]|uniref:hypothetical protein n=1 Tax=Photobacterium sp. WH24 TaxID=2827237 RepID=UPI001C49341F
DFLSLSFQVGCLIFFSGHDYILCLSKISSVLDAPTVNSNPDKVPWCDMQRKFTQGVDITMHKVKMPACPICFSTCTTSRISAVFYNFGWLHVC